MNYKALITTLIILCLIDVITVVVLEYSYGIMNITTNIIFAIFTGWILRDDEL